MCAAAVGSEMTILYVDADACPVKNEVYRVADRYALPVIVVSNSWIRVPRGPQIRLVVVEAGPDAADDWIAARAGTGDVVITADTHVVAGIPRGSTRGPIEVA